MLGGADSLSAKAKTELEQIKVFGVANSYLKHRHVNQFIYWLKTYFEMEPGTTD